MNLSRIQGRLNWLPSRIHDHFPAKPIKTRGCYIFLCVLLYPRRSAAASAAFTTATSATLKCRGASSLLWTTSRSWESSTSLWCSATTWLWPTTRRAALTRECLLCWWAVKRRDGAGSRMSVSRVVKKWRQVWWSFHSDDINVYVFPHLMLKNLRLLLLLWHLYLASCYNITEPSPKQARWQ